MKKLMLILGGIILVGGLLYSQPPENPGPKKFGPKAKIREVVEIRKQMRRIEFETIQNNEELKKIADQIKTLREELREKLEEALADNVEYQELKEKLKRIKEEWRKKRHKREGKEEECKPAI